MSNRPFSATTTALTIGEGTFASRLLGFARDAAIAALVGAGGAGDALLLAFRIPNAVRQLLAEGAFAYVLVPAYTEQKHAGYGNASRCIRSIGAVLFLLFALTALAAYLFAEPLALLLAPGFADAPEIRALAASLVGPCFVALPFTAGAAVFSAALMAEGNVRSPAYSSALFNAVIIMAAGVAFIVYGTGHASALYCICWGVAAAGLAQWLTQARSFSRIGGRLYGPLAPTAPEVTRTLRALPGSFFGIGGHQANMLAAAFFASFLAEGSVSSLYFAERLLAFPLGIIGASVGLAALIDLSSATSAAEQHALFSSRLTKAMRATLFFALPAAVGVACLATPLTAAIFGRGEFGAADTARTSAALLAYMFGLPALALTRPLLAACSAIRDTKTPFRSALAAFAVTILVSAALLVTNASWAPALAVSLAAYANLGLLLYALGKNNSVTRSAFSLPPSWLVRVLVCNVVMAACVLGYAFLVSSNVAKLGAVPLGVAIYFGAAWCMRLEESALAETVAQKIFRNRRNRINERPFRGKE
ncbi:MAG: putative lipid II flippase MurJ [Desulfovibrio sp.]